MTNGKRGPVDFGIVTALRIEREAVLERIDEGFEKIPEEKGGLTFYLGQVTIPSGGCYSVVVVQLLGVGNDESAIGTTRLIERWQPRHVLMVGIAGGVRARVALGDVLVADAVHYYEPAKLTSDAELPRSQTLPTSRLLLGRAQAYELTDWKSDIRLSPPNCATGDVKTPNVYFGTIAAGEKVIADTNALAKLTDANSRISAVAMEGAGVAKSVLSEHPSPEFIEVRAICDLADEHKNDDWQPYAANAAAAFVIGFLRDCPVPSLSSKTQVGKTAPILIIRAQSLRPIAPDELVNALDGDLENRHIETVALDFTDLVHDDVLANPEEAARRLSDPQSALFAAMARRDNVDLIFHGLVHIPLAMLAGHLVTDRQRVRLFDFHPNVGVGTWIWPAENAQRFPPLEVRGLPKRALKKRGDALIRIAVSYGVAAGEARKNVRNAPMVIDLSVPKPQRGIVQSEEQTRAYGRDFRRVIDTIAQRMAGCERIHVFYAGPVALAFHLGQQVSANIHPPVVVWNFRRNKYEWGIDLAAASQGESCIVLSSEQ